jgi:hypothetical protein
VARDEQGRAILTLGRTEEELRLVDEALIIATFGDLSPIVTGIVYCNALAVDHRMGPRLPGPGGAAHQAHAGAAVRLREYHPGVLAGFSRTSGLSTTRLASANARASIGDRAQPGQPRCRRHECPMRYAAAAGIQIILSVVVDEVVQRRCR